VGVWVGVAVPPPQPPQPQTPNPQSPIPNKAILLFLINYDNSNFKK